jgi:uncharacterized membrane protein YccC
MRVSDAERNEVAEALSKHYGDGRLDAAEFQERLDQAMSAKTRADLSGLLSDLPPTAQANRVVAPPAPPAPRRRPRSLVHVLAVVAVLFVLAGLWSAMVPPHVPWLLIAVIVFLVWRRDRFHRYYRYRYRHLDERPW